MNNDFKNIKAVLFDFDDTLGHRESYAYDTFYRLLKSCTDFEDEMELETILQDVMIWDEQGNIQKQHIVDMLKKKYDITLPCADFKKWWNEEQWKASVPFPDTISTLEQLQKKYKLGIITNGDSTCQRNKIQQAGLSQFFDESNVVVSGDYGYHKPDTRLFTAALEKLNVRAEESVFVGDIFANDIIGAYRAYMKPIWIWTHGERKCTADVTMIHKISDLLKIL